MFNLFFSMYKKWITVMKLRKLISFVCCLIFIFTFAVSNIYAAASTDENAIDNYLLKAGFSEDMVDKLPLNFKQQFCNEEAILESCTITYGILTEDYSVNYTLDENQRIVIDKENLQEFKRFINDSEAVERVRQSKRAAYSPEFKNLLEVSDFAYYGDTNATQNVSPNRMISETNWSAALFVAHKSHNNEYVDKYISYLWYWNYNPKLAMHDKMAVAWSDKFTLLDGTIKQSYIPMRVENGEVVYSANPLFGGMVEHNLQCGFGIDFNIVKTAYDRSQSASFFTNAHAGFMQGVIRKNIDASEVGRQKTACAKGVYYHQTIAFDGSLGFSSEGPDISVSWSWCYEESPESYISFDYYE